MLLFTSVDQCSLFTSRQTSVYMYIVIYLLMLNKKRKKCSSMFLLTTSRAGTLINRWMFLGLLSSLQLEKLSCRWVFHYRHLELMPVEEQSRLRIQLMKITRRKTGFMLCQGKRLYPAWAEVRSCTSMDTSRRRKHSPRCCHWQYLVANKKKFARVRNVTEHT